jgi:ActR/RegA family two-component response regulator
MSDSQQWILLVEDDPIFSMLFCRFWKGQHSRVLVTTADSLAAARRLLEQASVPPLLAVVDRTLPDGDGHEWAGTLSFPHHCWSALGEGGCLAKPKGKTELEASLGRLAELAGL